MKSILILVASVAFAISPFLSPEFGGFDPERYPNPQYDPPVQPAGWAFSIWGLIYLALIAHAVVGVWRHRSDPAWEGARLPLFISLAIGAIWLPVALISPVWATVLICIMLLGALVALHRLKLARPNWIARWSVALYAGWLSAASFVSIGLLMAGYDLTAEVTAAYVALALAVAFAATNAWRGLSWPYGAAVAWGFLGVAAANYGAFPAIAAAAGGAAGVMIVLAALRG